MSHRITLPSVLAGMIAVVALAACGGSSAPSSGGTAAAGSGSSPASSSSPASNSGSGGTVDASSCPSASTVGSALGVTVATPTAIDESGDLPSGATGIGCEYLAGTSVVIVVRASGVPSSYFATEEQAEQQSDSSAGLSINFTPLSGVGSQAASYSYTAGGVTASGVIAQQGGNVAGVFTSMLSSVGLSGEENLVKQLL